MFGRRSRLAHSELTRQLGQTRELDLPSGQKQWFNIPAGGAGTARWEPGRAQAGDCGWGQKAVWFFPGVRRRQLVRNRHASETGGQEADSRSLGQKTGRFTRTGTNCVGARQTSCNEVQECQACHRERVGKEWAWSWLAGVVWVVERHWLRWGRGRQIVAVGGGGGVSDVEVCRNSMEVRSCRIIYCVPQAVCRVLTLQHILCGFVLFCAEIFTLSSCLLTIRLTAPSLELSQKKGAGLLSLQTCFQLTCCTLALLLKGHR